MKMAKTVAEAPRVARIQKAHWSRERRDQLAIQQSEKFNILAFVFSSYMGEKKQSQVQANKKTKGYNCRLYIGQRQCKWKLILYELNSYP